MGFGLRYGRPHGVRRRPIELSEQRDGRDPRELAYEGRDAGARPLITARNGQHHRSDAIRLEILDELGDRVAMPRVRSEGVSIVAMGNGSASPAGFCCMVTPLSVWEWVRGVANGVVATRGGRIVERHRHATVI